MRKAGDGKHARAVEAVGIAGALFRQRAQEAGRKDVVNQAAPARVSREGPFQRRKAGFRNRAEEVQLPDEGQVVFPAQAHRPVIAVDEPDFDVAFDFRHVVIEGLPFHERDRGVVPPARRAQEEALHLPHLRKPPPHGAAQAGEADQQPAERQQRVPPAQQGGKGPADVPPVFRGEKRRQQTDLRGHAAEEKALVEKKLQVHLIPAVVEKRQNRHEALFDSAAVQTVIDKKDTLFFRHSAPIQSFTRGLSASAACGNKSGRTDTPAP